MDNNQSFFFIRDEQGSFLSAYGWEDVIQIDHSNVIQQDAMINAMKGWVTGYDIDGFRADLAHLTPLSFWEKAREATGEHKKILSGLLKRKRLITTRPLILPSPGNGCMLQNRISN